MKLPRRKKEKKLQKEKILLHTSFDMALILDAVFLNLFGIIMIYSASYYYASVVQKYAPTHYMIRQAAYLAAGIVAMIVAAFFRPRIWKKLGWLWYIFALGFVLAVRVPGLGYASHGAYRWIKMPLGQTLQVAEPIKVCLILFLAFYMSEYRITHNLVLLLVFGLFTVMAGLLLVLSNNLSTAIVIMLMMFFTLMMNHPKQKGFYIFMILMVLLAVFIVVYIEYFKEFDKEENFRITRIRAWLHPNDPDFADDVAYQATQALYAIASGGFFGRGLGQSLVKYSIPEPHNDYILAIVFEELGVFGVIILTFLFVCLLYRIYVIWLNSRDYYSRILCLSVFFHIAFQVIINYAVTLGLFPTTGVTLTFISSGGTAAFFTLIEIGLVLAVDRENKERVLYYYADKEVKAEDPLYKQALEAPETEEEEPVKTKAEKRRRRAR